MYKFNNQGQYPYYYNAPMYNPYNMYNFYRVPPYPFWFNPSMYNQNFQNQYPKFRDAGPGPFVVDIEDVTTDNTTFRTAIWTGENLQVTVMSIAVGDDIGLEVHQDGDQFIRIEEGRGLLQMGDSQDNLNFERNVSDDSAIMIPAGKWHNITNTGNRPLKLYVIYAPPQHLHGTVHQTKAAAEAAENQ